MNLMGPVMTLAQADMQRSSAPNNQMLWDREFQSQELRLKPMVKSEEPQHVQDEGFPATQAPDEMARLAAEVIKAVQDEENPKFKQSTFINLMRQLRDGEVLVNKDGIVSTDTVSTSASTSANIISATTSSRYALSDIKGKRRALEIDMPAATEASASVFPLFQEREGANESHFRQENEDYRAWWGAHYAGPSTIPTWSSTTSASATLGESAPARLV